jgi:hypothetical protein
MEDVSTGARNAKAAPRRPGAAFDAKEDHPGHGVGPAAVVSVSVVLDARGAQAGQTVLIDGELPAQEFLGGEGVSLAGFLQAEQSAPDGGDHFGLATDHPSPRGGRRKIRNG